MNGVHDLGGMHGFGPVEVDEEPSVPYADWECAVRAIHQASRSRKIYNVDEFRYGIERMNPARYLSSSYYEHWFDGICRILEEKGVINLADLDARTDFFQKNPDAPARAAFVSDPPTSPPDFAERGGDVEMSATAPRYQVGDTIIARNEHPIGHTRLPRYARGKRGTITRVHGAFILPDAHAHGLGAPTETVYNVLFEGRDLWGDNSDPNQSIYLDCWESYLLPAGD